jgi:hypothetical protein
MGRCAWIDHNKAHELKAKTDPADALERQR